MHTLSTAAIAEKNALVNTGAWLILMEITFDGPTTVRVCSNTANIVWPTGGDTYTAFPFELEEVGDSAKGERPKVTVRLGNASRVMEQYMEAGNGGIDAEVTLRVVHSAHLNLTDPEIELTYRVIDARADSKWAHFTLGSVGPFDRRWPRNRVFKNFCRYKVFKGTRCGYAGAETVCDRTLTRCRELGNSDRFGGAPGAGRRGLYA